jgi:hypothetical protein
MVWVGVGRVGVERVGVKNSTIWEVGVKVLMRGIKAWVSVGVGMTGT